MGSEMELGECLRDRQGNWYRVDSWTFEDIGFGEARLTVEMTPVKERTDMDFISTAGLAGLGYGMVRPAPAFTIGSGQAKENGMNKNIEYFRGLSADVKKREFEEDLVVELKENLALFHECVMKTEDVEGVYIDGRNTTVRWSDGSHTTVHCGEDDVFDPMLGFLLCVAKRHFGDTGRYLEVMRRNGIPEMPRPTTLEIDMTKVSEVLVCAG